MKRIFFIAGFLILFLSINLYSQKASNEYVKECWQALSKREFKKVYELVEECSKLYGTQAFKLSKSLKGFPPKGEEAAYNVMNDVATCLFIKGEALMREGRNQEAKKVFKKIIEDFPYAQSWDPRGWWWKIAEKSKLSLDKLEKGILEEELRKPSARTHVILWNRGSEKIVNYEKYGEFIDEGTEKYRYKITDLQGLIKAVGEGVYPDINSFRKNPRFEEVKKKESFKKLNHWEILNTQDLEAAFFKWCIASEPKPVKQFFRAQILERSGLIAQAIKGYYAILVHFPKSYGWTYWHTPWYLAKASATRIKYLIRRYPELNMRFEGCKIKIINGFDNEVSNDIFIVSPGRIKKETPNSILKMRKRKLGRVIEERTKGRIKLVKYEKGDWQLLVDGKPFLIKGVSYFPAKVGESPDNGTLRNWMEYDYNNNGIIDCFEVFVDKNRNNKKDPDEKITSDFALMKEMGVNVIRIYYQPFEIKKDLLRKIYKEYGTYVIMGDFLGKYALGCKTTDWFKGVDYENPEHKKSMIESVKEMVLKFKDEPYILAWMLGNENNYGIACNADKKPKSFYKFVNEVAEIIKKIDPYHPIILCNGDTVYLDVFAKYCDNIDIFGTNAYRGKYGFGFLWEDVKELCDKPVVITEYGAPAFGEGYTLQEAENYQAEYHRSCWQNILENSAGFGCGNALGGIIFEWVDEWWKAYEPAYHDKKGLFAGPFLDGYMHEEWLGICGQGDGKNSPFLRNLRKAYHVLKRLWRSNKEEVK